MEWLYHSSSESVDYKYYKSVLANGKSYKSCAYTGCYCITIKFSEVNPVTIKLWSK